MLGDNKVAHFTDENGHKYRQMAPWPTEDHDLCREIASRHVGAKVVGPMLFVDPEQGEIDRMNRILAEIDAME